MAKIHIANLHKKFKLNERSLQAVAGDIARATGLKDKELAVIFLDSRRMRSLNRRFRREDRATDVLSFGACDDSHLHSKRYLGDVFISLDAARRNSELFGRSFEEETVLYIIHGILHLIGYEDERPRARAKMRRKEEEILSKICRTRDLSKVSTRR